MEQRVPNERGPEAVVLTGVYGAGKSSVVEEMAGVLERAGVAYAAVDLDWLWWFGSDRADGLGRREVLMGNLSAVVDNYLDVGVERFVMAWAIEAEHDLESLRGTLAMPLRVARLVVPAEVIRKRLLASPTSDRRNDLEVAERWLVDGTGADIGDLELAGDRSVPEVAADVLRWLGWV